MKTQQRHIFILMTLFLMSHAMSALAANRTFTVRAHNSDRGEVAYRINGGSLSTWAASHSVTAADGASITVYARCKSGNTSYEFSHWSVSIASASVEGTSSIVTYHNYTFQVSSDYASKTVTAYFTGWGGELRAGSTYYLTNTTGNSFKVTSATDSNFNGKEYDNIGLLTLTSGGSSKIVFNTSAIVFVTGQIKVTNGLLAMELGDGYSGGHSTLKRHNRNTTQEVISTDPPADMTDADKCTLIIKGNPSQKFTIHGNCNDIRVDSTNLNNIHFTKASTDVSSNYGLLQILGGKVDMEYVSFTHSWRNNKAGAAIHLATRKDGDIYRSCPAKVTMQHSLIEWCRTLHYGAAIDFANYVNGSTFDMTDCEVKYCDTDGAEGESSGCGGAIRSMGSNLCELRLTDCILHHNYTMGHGGALRWHSALIAPMELTRCTFSNNWARAWGGAMRMESGVVFDNCTIKNNHADAAGGGISYGTFIGGSLTHLQAAGVYVAGDAQGGYYPRNGVMNLDANTIIMNNSAGGYGGGIHIFADFISFPDGSCTVYLNENHDPYKMGFEMNGTLIKDNTAGLDGGAVYISRNTEYYGIDVNLKEGTIDHNTATGGNGGSFCVTESITVPYVPSSGHLYQPIRAYVGSDDISVSGNLNMIRNTAVNGGGLYLENGSVSIYGNALVGGNSTNANKSVGGNGGGVYISTGDLHMYDG